MRWRWARERWTLSLGPEDIYSWQSLGSLGNGNTFMYGGWFNLDGWAVLVSGGRYGRLPNLGTGRKSADEKREGERAEGRDEREREPQRASERVAVWFLI